MSARLVPNHSLTVHKLTHFAFVEPPLKTGAVASFLRLEPHASLLRLNSRMEKPSDNLKSFVTVSMAAGYLKSSRQAVWDGIKRNRLETVRVGRLVLISRRSLTRYKKTRRPGGPRKKKKT
jgi:excisionase family DNA binding protein